MGALEGDGLRSEERESGSFEIVTDAGIHVPGDAVCLRGGVELGDGEPDCPVPGPDPERVGGRCGGDDVMFSCRCCSQLGGLGEDGSIW